MLAVVGLAQLIIVLDITIMNIALPSAQAALRFSEAGRQWVITGYALAFGSLRLRARRPGGPGLGVAQPAGTVRQIARHDVTVCWS